MSYSVNAVPGHWRRMKLKHLVQLRSGDAISGDAIKDEGDYPVYGGNGLRGYTNDFNGEGDRILVGRQGALCGNINYAAGKFWATEHAIVATPKMEFETTWLGETLRAMNLNQYSQSAAQPGIAVEIIENLDIEVPPLDEQKQIAHNLASQIEPIDALIGEKRRLLELLAEKRRTLITDAVTRGLNPNASLRDSGIPWLGEVPAHWEVRSLRRLVTSLEQGWSPVASNQPASAGEYGVLKLSAIKSGHFWAEENKALLVDDDVPEHLTIRKDDVLITRANTPGLVGDVAVAHENYPRLIFSDLIYRLRCDNKAALPAWLAQVLLSGIGRGQIEAEAKGSSVSMVKLAQDQVLGLLLPTPPKLEQHVIAEYIQAETKKLNDLAEAAERTIALLQERRSALIYAAVSGTKGWGKSNAH